MKPYLSLLTITILLFSFTACSNETTTPKSPLNVTTPNTLSTDDLPAQPAGITAVYDFDCSFPEVEVKTEIYQDPQNGNSLPYRLYFPENYTPTETYPILLVLHGAGEIGDDNQRQLQNTKNLFACNGDLLSQGFVLCPQSNTWWNLDYAEDGDEGGTLGSVLHLLTDIQSTYSCDKNRVYVTGLSMGGYATWDLLQDYGHLFAAGIPVCGGGNTDKAKTLVDIPIKIYHSQDDDTVGFYASQKMYEAIVAAGGNKAEFIQLDGIGHASWDYTYSDRAALCWLYAQHKTNNPSGAYTYLPYFKVCDDNGNTIVTEEDFDTLYYTISYEGDQEKYTMELLMTEEGRKKLDKAYTAKSTFTAYWLDQKMYSFTANQATESNIFSIAGVFTMENVFEFNDTLTTVMDMRRRLVTQNICFERK